MAANDKEVLMKADHVKVYFKGKKKGQTVKAVDDVSFEIMKGETFGVVGESGCGKSTLLEIVADLLDATSGEVLLDGQPVHGTSRDIGVVFQDASLFPWRTVRKNVAFGLEIAGVPKEEREERLKRYISMVSLNGFENKYPAQLSGGMRQRAGIARTLAMNPKVILMDEPFSAVDHLTKCTLQEELINIRQAENKTVLFVTHDINEAVFLADRVVLLSPRPSTIQKIYEIPLEQKRGRSDPLLLKIAADIAKDINSGGQDIPNNYWGNL